MFLRSQNTAAHRRRVPCYEGPITHAQTMKSIRDLRRRTSRFIAQAYSSFLARAAGNRANYFPRTPRHDWVDNICGKGQEPINATQNKEARQCLSIC
jgi:hypothetical protein